MALRNANSISMRWLYNVFCVFIVIIVVSLNCLLFKGDCANEASHHHSNLEAKVDLTILDIKYRPWKEDPECDKYFIEFIRNGNQPKMGLTSYPGSGNTWTRGTIERLTGYFTGSVKQKIHFF